MLTLQFVGVGPMRATSAQWQTNAVITYEDDGIKRHLLIDCGEDNRHALEEAGILTEDVRALYVSHLHGDHVGGVGSLALATYFHPKLYRPELFCEYQLMHHLWEHALRGGLDTIEGKMMTLTDYFDCHPGMSFKWSGIEFQLVQTLHIVAGYQFMNSYGLMIKLPSDLVEGKKIFFTGDTQFCPHQIQCFYDEADLIIHDCETSAFCSKVHAHFDDLTTLDEATKNKMWLVHYQPGFTHDSGDFDMAPMREMQDLARMNGFAGFIKKGQVFDLGTL